MTKEEQFKIIQKYNPATDSYHTHIRSAEECHTFEEIADKDLDELLEIYGFGDDLTQERIDKALQNGFIDVYHGNNNNGIGCFVATSSGMAYEYAGGGSSRAAKVWHAIADINDIAWIDVGEGIALKPLKWELITVTM